MINRIEKLGATAILSLNELGRLSLFIVGVFIFRNSLNLNKV